MSYREHAAPRILAPWLACTWERTGQDAPVRVLPDGCIDIVWTEGLGTQVVGANSSAFVVALAPGTRVLGARLRPGGAPALLGVGAEALRDERVPAGEVLGDAGRRLGVRLDETRGAREVLLAALGGAAAHATAPDALVAATVARLREPGAAVADVASEVGLSERQLRRRVRRAVGYGPKRLARVLRLERALAAARGGDDLARAALDAGFADQAHFANDCRELAGVPPSVLCKTPAAPAITLGA